MKNCPKCGSPLPEGVKFCPTCSYDLGKQPDTVENTAQTEPSVKAPSDSQQPNSNTPPQGYNAQPSQQPPVYTPYPAVPNNGNPKNYTGLLVWSIVNLVCCCLPLGIVGLVFTVTSKNEMTAEAQEKKLKNAFICNLIGTIVGFVVEIIWVFLNIILAF